MIEWGVSSAEKGIEILLGPSEAETDAEVDFLRAGQLTSGSLGNKFLWMNTGGCSAGISIVLSGNA